MSSVRVSGVTGGLAKPAALPSAKPAQGLFGAKVDGATAPLPRQEQFARV